MGKRSTKEQPPRLWPCEKVSSAGFEPRSADAERRANPGVTAGETADGDGGWALLLAGTVGATALAFAIVGIGWGLKWLGEQPGLLLERLAAGVVLVVGFGAVVVAALWGWRR